MLSELIIQLEFNYVFVALFHFRRDDGGNARNDPSDDEIRQASDGRTYSGESLVLEQVSEIE